MSSPFKPSPGRRHGGDLESGRIENADSDSDTFSIPAKNASVERLQQWRVRPSPYLASSSKHYTQRFLVCECESAFKKINSDFSQKAALVLNASRRFRYTLDLKKEQEAQEMRKKIRTHAHALLAANRFIDMGRDQVGEKPIASATPAGDFGIGPEQLVLMSKDHNIGSLQQYGGAQGLADLLKTNTEKGISGDDEDLLNRKNIYGSNTYPRKKGKGFLRFLWDACHDLTLIILMVAAVASLALGIKTEGIKEGWYDGGSIAFAVILVIVVTAVSDYKQSLQFQNLNDEKRNIHLEVIRGGRRVEVSIYDLVVGDVIPLNIGNQVPADGVLIAGHSLALDESSMTGESKIVNKDANKDPFLMSGCKVADGNGVMLVTGVGVNTEWGLLMASISEDNDEETPLQVRLNGVATFIGSIGLFVAACVLVILLVRYFTGHTEDVGGGPQFVKGKTKIGHVVDDVIKVVTVAVTIVVVAVPEGLPLAVTLTYLEGSVLVADYICVSIILFRFSLAYSMRKMMADKALVRRLSACETMGSATTICSDKTGTLTLNQMTVVESYAGGKKTDSQQLPATITSLCVEGIAQNTTGSIYVPEGGGDLEFSGSPTEKAILGWGVKLGMNFETARSQSSILHAFPFSSEKKRGGVAVKTADGEVRIHWKGASEIVLACCRSYIDEDGNVAPMTEEKEQYFKNGIEEMAGRTLRCVALAFRTYEPEKVPTGEELSNWVLPEDGLILLAIVGIKDPCRPGVRDSVQLCQNAGVKVRMVTGDNVQTARAIALDSLILCRGASLNLDILHEHQMHSVIVMGRSSPNDKLLLVQSLRRRGHVVAVTGDGTNDAPALHEADIGLAMGIAGTEVAKESSDIIILDDNFASVVKVVRWGRSVYANIQKFIQFQLTVNVAALIINVVAAISSGDVPLTAVQLLWVNLIMDTLGALALATEPPTDHLMGRPPVGRNILGLQHEVPAHATRVKNTIIFNAFVLCQAFNEFNARKPDEKNIFKGVIKNRLFMGIIVITLVLQVIIVEFLGKFASTTKLNWKQWLICVAIGVISWPLALVGKFIPVPKTPLSSKLSVLKFWGKRKSSGEGSL
ncbi:hypothetical protein Bca4012_045060 [Brassica carinata]